MIMLCKLISNVCLRFLIRCIISSSSKNLDDNLYDICWVVCGTFYVFKIIAIPWTKNSLTLQYCETHLGYMKEDIFSGLCCCLVQYKNKEIN